MEGLEVDTESYSGDLKNLEDGKGLAGAKSGEVSSV